MEQINMNKKRVFIGLLIGFLPVMHLFADRIKDITTVSGVRSNQLIGYGLVVGLDGTGDKGAAFTNQSFRSMLEHFGITVPPEVKLDPKNVAAVVVHADLPPFSKIGQKIDVTASSIGNAKSLRGGSLLMAPLKGADNQIYAFAQGSLVVGGFGFTGTDGSNISVNVPSVGRIPNGASIERSLPSSFEYGNSVTLNLNRADFTTAKRVMNAINRILGPDVAEAIDAVSVRVKVPQEVSKRVTYLSLLENIEVEPGEESAKVVVNSRTGTIVIGKNVRVGAAAVTHGSLTVTITEDKNVSQPSPFATVGETVVTDQSNIDILEEKAPMFLFSPGVQLGDIVESINQIGASPADLMAILEALKQAGALRAHLEVI